MGYIGVGSHEEGNVVKHQKKESCYLVQEYMTGGSLKAKVWKQVRILPSSLNPLLG